MSTFRLLIFPIIFIFGVTVPFLFLPNSRSTPSLSTKTDPTTPSPFPSKSSAFSSITLPPTATPTPAFGLPVQIEIPSISLNTAISKLGLTSTGGLDVPANAMEVGWFDGSPRPGLPGGTVLAGHYDTPSGRPAAFYRLKDLKPGDSVFITTDRNQRLEFVMEKEINLPYKDFPLDLVYGTITSEELRIITCDGVWNDKEKSYSNRLVVFAKRPI